MIKIAAAGMFYACCSALTGGLAVLALETSILLAHAGMIPAWLT